MFKIIRCGLNYDLVIAVSPETATPDTEDAKYYRFASWKIGEYEAYKFNEISRDAALMTFSRANRTCDLTELKTMVPFSIQ